MTEENKFLQSQLRQLQDEKQSTETNLGRSVERLTNELRQQEAKAKEAEGSHRAELAKIQTELCTTLVDKQSLADKSMKLQTLVDEHYDTIKQVSGEKEELESACDDLKLSLLQEKEKLAQVNEALRSKEQESVILSADLKLKDEELESARSETSVVREELETLREQYQNVIEDNALCSQERLELYADNEKLNDHIAKLNQYLAENLKTERGNFLKIQKEDEQYNAKFSIERARVSDAQSNDNFFEEMEAIMSSAVKPRGASPLNDDKAREVTVV